MKFWHYTSGKCLQTIDEVRQTLALTINPEGTHIITAGAEPQIHMYDMETKQKVNTMEPRWVKVWVVWSAELSEAKGVVNDNVQT